MYRISKEIREEILEKVKQGQKAVDLAKQYGISDKTIYRWLQNQISVPVSVLAHNKLKKENDELKRIIGILSLEVERKKKGCRS